MRGDVCHHRIAEHKRLLQKTHFGDWRNACDRCAGVLVGGGQNAVALRDEMHAIMRAGKSAHKMRNVRARAFGAGNDIERRVEN